MGTTDEAPKRRADGVDDATVEAVGKVTEALEWVERARGHLYEFHQLMGHADFLFGDAAEALDDAGHGELGRELEEVLIGRNVLEGRWTFQIVEEFDDGYWTTARELERSVRDRLTAGERHVYESELKEERRTHGRRHHEARP